jgi:hypothetical protein
VQDGTALLAAVRIVVPATPVALEALNADAVIVPTAFMPPVWSMLGTPGVVNAICPISRIIPPHGTFPMYPVLPEGAVRKTLQLAAPGTTGVTTLMYCAMVPGEQATAGDDEEPCVVLAPTKSTPVTA